MTYCYYCGEEVTPTQDVCLHCGKERHRQSQNTLSSVKDEGGFLWGLLGFLVPVAGLIVYLIWKDDKPLNARSAGIGALVYVGLSLTFVFIYIMFFMSIFGFGVID
ncbi:MAG: hypothetical protein UMR38_06140 [Candidatus Izemoplasma sp.]|nr:hypothetical protein [Candidatus Izemoplasma sp.]